MNWDKLLEILGPTTVGVMGVILILIFLYFIMRTDS